MFPYQPLEFIDWLRSYMVERGVPCVRILPRINGDLVFLVKDGKKTGLFFSKKGRNKVAWKGVDEKTAQSLASALRSLEKEYAPPFLAVANLDKHVIPLAADVLKDCLISKLEVNKTQWGPFKFTSLQALDKDSFAFRFESSHGAVVMNFFLLKKEIDASGKEFCTLSNMGLKVTEDCRDAEQRKALSFQVETFVGYAIGRSLHLHQKFLIGLQKDACPSLLPQDNSRNGRSDSIERYRSTRLESYIKQWKGKHRWRKFFYPETVYIEDVVKWGESDVYISHESLECAFNMSPGLLPEQHLFLLNRDVPLCRIGENYDFVFTDLCDRDAVGSGSMDKLEKALECAANKDKTKSIIVTTGCLADLMGDSPLPFMRRIRKRKSLDVYWFGKIRHGQKTMSQIIKERFEKTRCGVKTFDSKGVAFVCAGNEQEQAEMEQIVSLTGGNVLGSIVPHIGISAFEQIKTASTIVPVYTHRATLFISDWLKDDLLSFVHTPAPFGLSGTKNWLASVAGVFDKGDNVNDYFCKRVDPLSEELQNLKDKASNCVLGFVVDPADLEQLNHSTPFFGFEIFELLLEMGFCIDIIGFGEKDDIEFVLEKGPLAEKIGKQVGLHCFNDEETLHNILISSPCDLVFSHINSDPRAMAAGKGVFSEVFFEVGLQGMIRSYKRLLKAVQRVPLRSYLEYFGHH